ncbi:hypothetical protein RHGRI_010656 [Rhododendron griersonianum]|uniref:Uncharacterized protein n=1 Tax=Rhododendron griersonianum TaxID=479676 RepID=A0AAV6KJA5_9ERIC|nr:hypothetical protein RHGRI_010656 [Rhododendron griersonianum]
MITPWIVPKALRVSIGGGTTVSGGDTAMAVGHDPGDTVVGERRMAEEERHTVDEPIDGGLAVGDGDGSVMSTDEPRTGEGLIGVDTMMSEHHTVEKERRTVEGPIGGGSVRLVASTPTTPASLVVGTPVTPAGLVVDMEIGGLDGSMERQAMEERGTPASAVLHEFLFTPMDMPTEAEGGGVEDKDAKAVARRLERGKSVVGEGDRQEARVPLLAPLFTPPVDSSREKGVSLRHFRVCGPSGPECPIGGDSLVSERGGSSRG